MIIPDFYDAAPPVTASSFVASATLVGDGGSDEDGGSGRGAGNWSSLIGIVTAIVGNILISFALNTQRYAHTQLEQEWQEKERRRKDTLRRAGYDYRGYGTQQNNAAEGRAKANARSAPQTNGTRYRRGSPDPDDAEDGRDTDPLIPTTSRDGQPSSDVLSSSTSTMQELAEAEFKQRSYLRSPYWWAGIILMTTGEAGNFLAYGFAPASIVSPLGVVALVSNCIIAPLMFKEPFRKRDFFGVLVAVAGAVTVVLSASDSNPKLGPELIWSMITTWEFETYLGITILCIIGLVAASKEYGRKSILIDLGLVGLFGGYTALSTKGVASLLSYTLWRVLTFPISYLLIFVLVFTAIMQIKYINRALQRFDATQVIPTQFVLFTLSVILGSAVLYRDFERTNTDHALKFVAGCAMTFLGVWLITSKRPSTSDEEDREPEPADAINLVNGERYRDSIDGTLPNGADIHRPSSPPIAIPGRFRLLQPSPPQTPTLAITPQEPAIDTPLSSAPIPSSPLATNPWTASETSEGASSYQHQQPQPPTTTPYPLNPSAPGASQSAPVLTPETQADTATSTKSRPRTPRSSSDHAVNSRPNLLQTPQNQTVTAAAASTPRLPATTHDDRERERARHSLAGPVLAANPLFMSSPLSSSLSAVVAELRRGGSVRSSTLRHSGSVGGSNSASRRSTIGQEDEDVERRRSAAESAARAAAVEDEGGTQGKSVRRGRSLSGTLGELFRWMGDGEVESESIEERPGEGRAGGGNVGEQR